MKAKFMFSLICVAAVMLTACEEYPYGYYSHGSSYGYYSPYGYGGGYSYPYGGYRYGYGGYGYPYGGYGYGGYGYPTVAVAIGGNGYHGGHSYRGDRDRGKRSYPRHRYGSQREYLNSPLSRYSTRQPH